MTSDQRTPFEAQRMPWIKPGSYPRRCAAWVVNFVLPYLLLHLILAPVAWWLMVAWIGFNACWMRGRTGRSLGEVLFNLRVCRFYESDFDTSMFLIEMTPAVATMRTLCRTLDMLPLFYGVIRPLRQRFGQTFSDEMTHTVVIKDHPRHVIHSKDQVFRAEGRQ